MTNARDKANIPALNFSSTGIDDNATSTAVTIDSSQRVGIGTASPTSLLTVEGTSVIADFKSTNNNNVVRIKGNNATNGVAIGSTSSDDFLFTTNVSERMRIQNSTGNVGIGTSSPNNILELSKSNAGAATSIIVRNSNGVSTLGNKAELHLGNTNSLTHGARISADFVGTPSVDHETDLIFSTTTASSILTEAMRITGSGNVGIGTSSPSAGLDVVSTTYPYIAEFRQANAGNPGGIVIDSPADNGGRPSFLNFETGGVLKWGLGLGYNDTNRSFHISTSSLGSGITGSKFTITTSGNVGIGTSTPDLSGFGSGTNGLEIKDATIAGLRLNGNNSDSLYLISGAGNHWIYGKGAVPLTFSTNGTERMRIDSSGNLLVGRTAPVFSGQSSITGGSSGALAGLGIITLENSQNTTYKHTVGSNASGSFVIYRSTDYVGVYLGWGSTSWSANSDERLKTNLQPITDAVNKIKSLRTVTGRYITDDENISRSFLIAQDVQKVLPEAVDEQNNEERTLGLAYTDVIPLIIASIKEQQTKIEQLEARITALETNNP